jgi:glycine cleavage system H protein
MTTYFTKDHEWITIGEDGSATIGITDHAQEELGEVVFVELPQVGDALKLGDTTGVVESTKAVSDIYSPCTGVVAEINGELANNPALINEAPSGAGWLFRLTNLDNSELAALMDADAYANYLKSL